MGSFTCSIAFCLLLCLKPSLGGYLVTAPNRFIVDTPERVCISMHNTAKNQYNAVTVNFTLKAITALIYPNTNDQTSSEKDNPLLDSKQIVLNRRSGWHTCTTLRVSGKTVKRVKAWSLMLNVNGRADSGDYVFNNSKAIQILQDQSPLTFIETDKPIYKPGQTVRFRILSLDASLKPITHDITQVYVESPSGVRVDQWLNVKAPYGLGDFTLQLSVEPELGTWKIQAKVEDKETEVNFKVDEYVLPTFDVVITPPRYLTLDSPVAEVLVCSKYTYGEPVKGDLWLTACIEEGFNWRYQISRLPSQINNLCLTVSREISGCVKLNLTSSQLGYDMMDEFQYGLRAVFRAKVVEKGTGVIMNATEASTDFYQSAIFLSTKMHDHAFKPGLPFTAKVSVQYPDKQPAPGRLIALSVANFEDGISLTKNFTSDENGEVVFQLPPVLNLKPSINVMAEAVETQTKKHYLKPSTHLYLKSWFSPDGNYLQISKVDKPLICGSEVELEIMYTTNLEQRVELIYQVIGPGDIISTGRESVVLSAEETIKGLRDAFSDWRKTTSPSDSGPRHDHYGSPMWLISSSGQEYQPAPVAKYFGTLRLNIPVKASMSPTAQVLVYYVTEEGEIVSDTTKLDIETCTENPVKMSFSHEKTLPGAEVTLSLQADPDSLCAYGVVDKSVYLMADSNKLTSETLDSWRNAFVLSESTRGFESGATCVQKSERSESEPSPPAPTTATLHSFRRSAPKLKRKERSIYYPGSMSSYFDAKKGFDASGTIVMTDLKLVTMPCTQRHFAIAYNTMPEGAILRKSSGVSRTVVEPTENYHTSSKATANLPKLSVRDYFPETWLWNLAVTNQYGQTQLTTALPHSITEWVGNAFCLNKQSGIGVSPAAKITGYQSFFVSLTLPYSFIRGETVPISVSVFNYLDQCLPVQVRIKKSPDFRVVSKGGESSVTLCVCAKDSQSHDFLITAETIGSVNVTVTSISIENDGICSPDLDVSNLIGVSDAIIKSVIVEPEGVPRQVSISEFACPDEEISMTQELLLPADGSLVPGSARAYISVVGDVMGPALSNLDDLLRMPYGCGEQNMLGFAPNIFVLQYLAATNRDTPEIKEKAMSHMKAGYQRELTYVHPDSSYSAFGPASGNSGSIWLTAFVVKCFSQARPYIYIDDLQLDQSIRFFKSKQMENGCFPQVGLVHNKEMQGGVGLKGDSLAPMTAYVLIAMLEAGLNSSDASVSNAVKCLDVQPINSDYTLALMAYAYSLYDPQYNRSLSVFSELLRRARKDSSNIHWQASAETTQPKTYSGIQHMVSADVETTSYALLAILRMQKDTVSAGLPVVRWLSKQRNSYGGFGSTQDTVIGLQALARYASLVYSEGSLNMDITVTQGSPPEQLAVFRLTDENSLVQYTRKATSLEPVSMVAKGTGCFLYQINLEYNIFAEQERRPAFVTAARVFRSDSHSNHCKQRKMNICTKYTGPGLSSNMAVIHVKLVSGWRAEPLSLKALLKDTKAKVQRYDLDPNGDVQLYFSELNKVLKCFSFEIQQAIEVKDTKPGLVVTYDYYKKELTTESEFEIWSCPTKYDESKGDDEVIVKPWLLSDFQQEAALSRKDGCPLCVHDVANLTSTSLCRFKHAYKAYWREIALNPIKVTADLRMVSKERWNRFADFRLARGCNCAPLIGTERGNYIALLGHWNETAPSSVIELDSESALLRMGSREERFLAAAFEECN